jgi:hypothetical protein
MSYFLLLLFWEIYAEDITLKAWRTAAYKEVRLRTGPLAKLYVLINTRKFLTVDYKQTRLVNVLVICPIWSLVLYPQHKFGDLFAKIVLGFITKLHIIIVIIFFLK